MAWKLGATDFLSLPVDHTEFVVRLRNLLLLRSAALTRAELSGIAMRPLQAGEAHWLEVPPTDHHSLAQFH
jgi:DNA-binding response OmpR family regulator